MDLSIVILSYKSKEHLQVLLPSIFGSEGIVFVGGGFSRPENMTVGRAGKPSPYTAEVIIVDNGSNDGTAEFVESYGTQNNGRQNLSRLEIIRNSNTGFAHGNNIGIRKSIGKYILLLNPDTKVEPDTFKVMLDFMEARPDVGMATCKIIKPDGSLDRAARRNFPDPWNAMLRFLHIQKLSKKPYNLSDSTADQEMEIDSLVGAFLLTRRSLVDRIGLLDEDFFMYGEDIDWCWRCKEAGFKVWYFPRVFITHYKGESSRKAPFKALKWFHDAMWVFYRKHYQQKYPFVFNWMVWLGIYGRLMMLTLLNLFKKNKRVSR